MVIRMNDKNIPKIRFKDFSEEWRQCRLEEIGNTFTGLSGKTKEDFGHGAAKFITYMNVFSNPVSKINKIEPIEIDNKQNQVKYGDIFFTTSSETPDEVGMSSVWLGNKENIYLNSFCFGFRPVIENNPYYMAYMLRSLTFRKNMILLAQGISRYNISKNEVMRLTIKFPTNEEQKKIGDLFSQIDKLIDFHQCKYEKLINIKKFLLEKMFPKNESNLPEVRFKDFTDAWEQCKLKDIGDILTGSTPSTSHEEYYSSKGMLWVTPTDINSNIIKTTAKMLSEKGEKVARIVPANTILITCIASIGKNAIVFEKSSFNQQINSLTPFNNYNPYFLLTESTHWSNKMKQQRAAGIMQIVNKNEFSELETMVPSFNEQIKIGNIFKQIDNLITLYQCKCEKLNNIKKSLLEKMFV